MKMSNIFKLSPKTKTLVSIYGALFVVIVIAIFVAQADKDQSSRDLSPAQAYSASYYKEQSQKSVTLFSRGGEVSSVKNRLEELGYLKGDTENDYFGLTAFWALRKFQKENGLTMNGVVNEETRGKLFPQAQTGFVEGFFSMIHADPIEAFSSKHNHKSNKPIKSENWYYITASDKKQYELKLPTDLFLEITPGTKIKVPTQFMREDKIFLLTPEDIEITEPYPYRSYSHMLQETRKNRGDRNILEVESTKNDGDPVEYKMLVIPVNVIKKNGGNVPSKQNIYNRIFNGPINDFFEKNSYNKITLTGNVLDTITTNLTCEEIDGSAALNSIYPIQTIANQNYDLFLFLPFNCQSIGDNWAGIAGPFPLSIQNGVFNFINGAAVASESYFINEHRWVNVIDEQIDAPLTNWTFFEQTLAHELGHTLWLGHSASIESCQDFFNIDECIVDEYGDRYDSMGGGLFSLHFDALSKHILGWLENDDLKIINTSGQYEIFLNEININSPKILKIKHPLLINSDTSSFYLTKRSPVNFDNLSINGSLWGNYDSALDYMTKGVFLSRYLGLLNLNSSIDYVPYSGSNQQYDQKPLTPGESITSDYFGFTIQNIYADSEKAIVDISFMQPTTGECSITVNMVNGYNPFPDHPSIISPSIYVINSETSYPLKFNEEEQEFSYNTFSSLKGNLLFEIEANSLFNCIGKNIVFENNFISNSDNLSSIKIFSISDDYDGGVDNFFHPQVAIYNQEKLDTIIQEGSHNFYFKAFDADTNEVYFYKDFHINFCPAGTLCVEGSEEDY